MTLIPRIGTVIVGVLNLTPDSFSDGGMFVHHEHAVDRAHALHDAGADIIDIGGESTRPGAHPVEPGVERQRVLAVIRAVAGAGLTVSIDTMHASTARAALDAGARIVNDVSGGLADPDMFRAVARRDCQYVLGHLRGTPRTMERHALYGDPAAEVAAELEGGVLRAVDAGIDRAQLVIDPGIGFAKDSAHNWALLRNLDEFGRLGLPLMLGVSRKRFLGELLAPNAPLADRDLPTAVVGAIAASRGVNALRVHDVASARLALAVSRHLDTASSPTTAIGADVRRS